MLIGGLGTGMGDRRFGGGWWRNWAKMGGGDLWGVWILLWIVVFVKRFRLAARSVHVCSFLVG